MHVFGGTVIAGISNLKSTFHLHYQKTLGVGEVGLDQNYQGLVVTMEIKAFKSKDGFVNLWMDVAKSA